MSAGPSTSPSGGEEIRHCPSTSAMAYVADSLVPGAATAYSPLESMVPDSAPSARTTFA